MQTCSRPIVIIGAGIAGASAAESLRNEGFDGQILMFDKGKDMPYDRPPLSKEYLLEGVNSSIMLWDGDRHADLNVDVELNTAIERVDLAQRAVIASDGRRWPFSQLLISSGSQLRRLDDLPGADLPGIHYLKSLEDATNLRRSLDKAHQVVIVGAGFIGSEVAAACYQMGKSVVMVEMARLPFQNILGDMAARFICSLHESRGVKIITEERVIAFSGTTRVEKVITASSGVIPSDVVVVGTGVVPTGPSIGKEMSLGYVVDEYGETEAKGVFAAGDNAMWPYRGQLIRVEHWDHAINQGRIVAKNMLNPQHVPYEAIPYFWSDQYDTRLQYVGHTRAWDRVVIRGDLAAGSAAVFYILNRQVVAGLLINQPKQVLPVRRFISRRTLVDEVKLGDEDIPLNETILAH
ncbi:MAG: ferredoxin reductase [Sulfobacillus benefaciens]|uniref:Ferredoxin reductase n=1 Tax=Sulfobacillus benefaciens TaxID=453960 RepID=A0A2T2XDU5_9FIRM|nr:MAG: ferredoxin reductase [Sulfobacillus benefaciens]